MQHIWTYEEDLLCCRRYLKLVKEENRGMTILEIARDISFWVPQIEIGSLRMKISNIKALAEAYRLSDGFAVPLLKNYSDQNKKAFLQALKEMGIDRKDKTEEKISVPGRPLKGNGWTPAPKLTELVNKTVEHKKRGVGIVTKILRKTGKDRFIVAFKNEGDQVEFAFPDAINLGVIKII